ncbi:MAG: 4-(cytidine 5'-diphospho)-2-C-methyl-D-erythritol kinase, partial [Acholeplasmatales bacterium]|nr:4-(cytidine 5'-diphospho)-2-C-methyl-D-erythritol kinase [Acholeplasmatales bacterium]
EKDIYKKAYSKVNLALEVMDTEGGYHKVNNLMAPIDLYDEMYFKYDDEIILEDNPYGDDNIIVKAAKAFKEAFGIKGGCKIICKKNIPAAAGLAGGSTDGATTLLGLCELYDINKKDKRIYDIAASLGSDVPFFLYNKIALCTNRGEVINTLDFDFKPIKVLLVKPELGLSTAAVYKEYKYDGSSKSDKINNIIDALKNDDIKSLKENIFNDLTTPALKLNADLNKMYNDINKTTTIFLSGSGPTLFIVDPNKTTVNKIKKEYKDIFIYEGLIKAKN